MWALRRTSIPLKDRSLSLRIFRACYSGSENELFCIGENAGFVELPRVTSNRSLFFKRFYSTQYDHSESFMGRRTFSSQVGMKICREENGDSENAFSELETPSGVDVAQDGNVRDENDEKLVSEPELSGEVANDEDVEGPQKELVLSDTRTDVSGKRSQRKRGPLALFKAIMAVPGLSVSNALDKWVKDGNDFTRTEIALAMLNLRRSRMYGRALQFLEWLESRKHLDFVERDYSSRIDLIAKVHGLDKAENYIKRIPKSFRGELLYRTFLANCVAALNVRKAEEVFKTMNDLQFASTSQACNQLLLLYKRTDKKKIANVLSLMKKENVKPSLITYKILIDSKGQSNDITGMDQIFETMKAEGIEPDMHTLAILAKHYVSGGLHEKAEAVLKEMEGGDTKVNRWACKFLLPLYAALGKADEVQRVWNACETETSPQIDECMAAIEAWGKLKKIEEAEAVFERMSKTWKRLSSKHYSALLKVYVEHKMLTKGKDLVKEMEYRGFHIGPLTWDALIKLYVEAGEVEKADSILHKAAQKNQLKPLFSSYMAVMEQYVKRGDIHNSEKIFHRMRQVGYVARPRQFRFLIQAYANAKAPAYGIRERMKADNVIPTRILVGQLAQVDGFRKSPLSELLDRGS